MRYKIAASKGGHAMALHLSAFGPYEEGFIRDAALACVQGLDECGFDVKITRLDETEVPVEGARYDYE